MLPSVGDTVGRDLGGQNSRVQDHLKGKRHLKCRKRCGRQPGRAWGRLVCSQLKEVSNDEEEQGQG